MLLVSYCPFGHIYDFTSNSDVTQSPKYTKLKDAGFIIDAWTIKGKVQVLRVAKMKIYLILVLP